MRDFTLTFDLITTSQSGFREFHSCQTALTKLTDAWLHAMDEGNLIGITFLDFSKAFDLVSHDILIEKLKNYNFDELSIKWFHSYLYNRTQCVKIGTTSSDVLSVTAGVPQGSILGPLLFLLYINDLPLHVSHANIDMFADDATLHIYENNIFSIETALNSDLENIEKWCLENQMALNIDKTQCMLMGTKQRKSKLNNPNLSLHVSGKHLNNVEAEKLLGVHIDQTLNFHDHVDSVCKSLTYKLFTLRKIKKFLPLKTRKLFYNAFILPSINYCLTIWGNAPHSYMERIHKHQKTGC